MSQNHRQAQINWDRISLQNCCQIYLGDVGNQVSNSTQEIQHEDLTIQCLL